MATNVVDYLVRFKTDFTQASQDLTTFTDTAAKGISRVASIPLKSVPQVPTPGPGFRTETPQNQARIIGAARQQVLGSGKVSDLTSAERRAIDENIARSFSSGKLNMEQTVAQFAKRSGLDPKEFGKLANQGAKIQRDILAAETDQLAIQSSTNQKLVQYSGTFNQKIAKEQEILAAKEIERKATLARAEVRAIENQEQLAKTRSNPAFIEAKTRAGIAANEAETFKNLDPAFQASELEKAAAKTDLALMKRRQTALQKRAAEEEAIANREAGYYVAEGEFQASVQAENQQILAAKRVAFNNALLANEGALLKVVGQGEVADMSSAAAIHGERARQLLGNPAVSGQIVADDTVTRKEAAIREGRVAENLAADKEYIEAKVQSAVAHKREAVLVEAGVNEKLATDEAYRAAIIQNTRAREIERLAILEATTQEDIIRQGRIAAEASQIKDQVRIAELEILSSNEALAQKAERIVLERTYNKALKESVASELAANGQKLAAFNVKYGRGGINGNTTGDTAGGAFGAGALSSLTHILPTLALFAAAHGIVESVKEAQELEIKLTNINFQLTQAGQSDSFGQVKKDILDLARETGIASTKIAEIRYQVQGAFGSDVTLGGLSGKGLVDEQTKSVAQISALTGFDSQKVVDSVTAVGLAFDVTGTQIGNASYQLEQKFGVRAQETLDFLGDIAPVVKQAGFSLEEFATIAAIAQQRSGQSGSAIAEKFSRAITGIAEKKNDLVKVISDSSTLNSNDALLQAVNLNDIRGIILQIGKVFDDLDSVTQDKLANVLGGPRNFQAILPALKGGDIEEKAKEIDLAENTLEQRFNKFNETFSQQLKQFGEALKQIGIAIYDAGLKDALSILVESLKVVAEIIGPIVRLFSSFNEALDGLPSKVLLLAGALKLLTSVNSTGKIGSLLNLGSGVGGAAATAGGSSLLGGFSAPVVGPFSNRGANPGLTFRESYIAQQRAEAAAKLTATRGMNMPGVIGTPPVPAYVKEAQATAAASAALAKNPLGPGPIAYNAKILGGAMGTAATKIGAFTRELPTGLVVAAAAFALVKLVETVNEIREAAKGASDAVVKRTLEKTPEQRQQDISYLRSQAKNFSFIDNALGYDPNSTADEIQRSIDAPGTAEAARRLLERKKTDPQTTRTKYEAKKLQEALDTLKSDPGNESAAETVNTILEYYKISDPLFYAAVKKAVEDAKVQSDGKAQVDAAKKEQTDKIAGQTKDLDSALADYQAGSGNILEVKEAYARLQETYRKATESGNDPALLADYKKNQAEQSKFLSKEIRNSQTIAREFNALVSSPEQAGQYTISQDLGLLRNPDFDDPSERLSVAKEIIDVQKKMRDAKLETFSSATEALAYIQANKATIDPEAQIAVIEAGLNESNVAYQEFLKAYKAFYGVSGEEFLKSLVRSIVLGDKTVEQVIAELEAKKAEMLAAGYQETPNIDKTLEIIRQLADSGQFKTTIDETEKTKQLVEKAHAEAVTTLKSQFDIYKSMINGDSVASAQIAVREAEALLALATKPDERNAAIAQLNQARISLANAVKARFLSTFDVLKSQTDDPLEQASIEVNKAQAALNSATPDERNGAIANLNNARKAQRQAFIAQEDAAAEFAAAMVKGDPIKSARLAQSEAQRKFREATTGADRLKAFAAKVSADQEFANAVSAIYDAQANVATALADFRGDAVESSRIAYNTAVRHLQEVRQKFSQGQAGEADVLNAQAEVTQAQAKLRDSQLQKQLDDYSFLYDMEKISKGQYIAYLEQLKNLPDLTTEQLRSIDRQIKGLKAELSQDLAFNVPNEITLPTLYEARRLNQSAGGYGEKGSGSYNDNRVITIEVNITDGQSRKDVLSAINDAVASGPQRFSNGVRNY